MNSNVRTARNIAIVVAIAMAVYFLPGGGRAASTFGAALWVAFAAGIGYFALYLYREHRVSLHSLGDRYRGLLYGAVALGVFVYIARARMWTSEVGKPAWWVLLACVVYALFLVYRRARAY